MSNELQRNALFREDHLDKESQTLYFKNEILQNDMNNCLMISQFI